MHQILLDCAMDQLPFEAPFLQAVITTALAEEGVTAPCEVNLYIPDDAEIHQLNLAQRNVDKPTDVLSFPMFEYEPGLPPVDDFDADPETGLTPLGDIIISLERVKAQAEEYGHSEQREMCYLLVHSVLHLLGYDHMDEDMQKAQMRKREEEILMKLGIKRGE